MIVFQTDNSVYKCRRCFLSYHLVIKVNNMKVDKNKFITCGMYAFTDPLRNAWQALFDEFLKIYKQEEYVQSTIRFDSEFSGLRDPDLMIGYTCGYPLMRFLRDDLVPICVPVFDLPGCQGKFYSSHIIVPTESNIQSLSDCKGLVAAINGRDSNSGMNVFRHAIALQEGSKPFFTEVLETGSHHQSVVAISSNQAQVATIDCVSYALIKDQWPDLVKKVRGIGFTEQTCGLPFVVPVASAELIKPEMMVDALNTSLSNLAESERNRLHLTGFESVNMEDYQNIIELESIAQQAGYPEIV